MKTEIDHDFETYCELDVRKVGAFCYAQHPSCEVLMLAWFDPRTEKMHQWFPHLQNQIPARLRELHANACRGAGVHRSLRFRRMSVQRARRLGERMGVR